MSTQETIASIGENEALRRTVSRLNPSEFAIVGSGDDAAVVKTTDDSFVVTTDTMIEGHDFRLDWSTWFDLGFKAIATNLSDVAAMGARPTSLVVAIALPSSTPIKALEDFADGLRTACEQLAPGCAVVGGDLAAAEHVFISVTAHGQLEGAKPVLRSGAKVGDVVAVAGTLGRAAAGLTLLMSGNSDAVNAYDDLVDTQRRPTPPIASGQRASAAGATSMLDISDGLTKDASRLCRDSNVGINLLRRDLEGYVATLEEAARAIDVDPWGWVLHGGEDHSLLATFPNTATLPREFKIVGQVVEGSSVTLDGDAIAIRGWDSVTGS